MTPGSPAPTPQPKATDLKTATALLQLALQLHHLRSTAAVLDGRSLTLDDDGYLLTPNAVREPGPLSVSVEFPAGTEIGAVFETLGFPFGNPALEQAVSLVAKAKEELDVARAKAKVLLEEFVFEFSQAA
ncbi:hypothetical protein AMC90_CH02812 [Rhizobium phaseoli]|uniref:hypothetical protein n=1 Tax=Rhizobium phaseoli TaxID=396 RepID=UPI0007EB62D6|nr:hypothetical protein [Rhizobium phaseoli]ANL28613.1 hypothetical protein AMC90_CH02812 [Rhizobium phaseoli]ANM04942.1 hypothetical protein AMC78_CH02864 [Rhizobium phaseoli]